MVQLPLQMLVENLVDKRALAGARNTGHTGHHTERKFYIDVLEIVFLGAPDNQPFLWLPSYIGNRNLTLSRQILPRDGFRTFHDVLCGSHGDQLAAVAARPRADIYHTVCRPHRFFIVLDNDNGISKIPEMHQSSEKLSIVSLMKANARLVQYVSHSDKSRSDLGGKPDTLCLTAGKRSGGSRQRQIIQSDFVEKAHTVPDFFQDLSSDQHLMIT